MILPDPQAPQYSLYYIGALILDLLKSAGGKAPLADIYLDMNLKHGTTYQLTTYALDWLYLAGAVERHRHGRKLLIRTTC